MLLYKYLFIPVVVTLYKYLFIPVVVTLYKYLFIPVVVTLYKYLFIPVVVTCHSLHFQSQDYDQCENTLFMKEQEKEKKVGLVVIVIGS